MKPIGSNITKSLEVGSSLVCADNSGGRTLKIIGVKQQSGTRARRVKAGIGDKVLVRVEKGSTEVKGEKFDAVIIRQKKPVKRPNGLRVGFEDNAAVILEDSGLLKGTKIKGVVAKEVIERYTEIGKVATIVS